MIEKKNGKISITKLSLLLFGFFVFFAGISGLAVYKTVQVPIGPHFAAAHIVVSKLQHSLLSKTILINLIFFLITSIGLLLFGVIYSHRVAGPLTKIAGFTRMIGKGNFNQRLKFRKKDVIHSLSIRLNEVAAEYEGRQKRLASYLADLEDDLSCIECTTDTFVNTGTQLKDILEIDLKITREFRDLKL